MGWCVHLQLLTPAQPAKHLHASMDLISLLHLDAHYNTYVRPYFDPVPETDDETAGPPKRPRKKQGLSKGYVGLLEDLIDPVPLSNHAEPSLLPLVGEFMDPPRPAPTYDPPTVLPASAFASARLEAGLKTEGYEGGQKLGAQAAHERRLRKKQARLSASVAPDAEVATPSVPRPRPPMRGRGSAVMRGMPRASAPPGYRPGTPQRTPGTPSKRPSDGSIPGAKRAKPSSRSASPIAGGGVPQATGPRAVFKRDY